MLSYARSALSSALEAASGGPHPFITGTSHGGSGLWRLHDGTRRDDGSPLTVFVFDARSGDAGLLPLARNALRRARTLRHPALLRFIDGYETDTKVVIATEQASPLADHRGDPSANDAFHPQLIIWGLYKVSSALAFLNSATQCNVVHGNVRMQSIFVTPAGEWRLFGFEVLSGLAEQDPFFFQYASYLPDTRRYMPPEVATRGVETVRQYLPSAVDSWGLACLISEVYCKGDPAGAIGIPQILQSSMTLLRSQQPAARSSVESFLEKMSWQGNYFDCDFVHVNCFLEELSMKDESEKQEFLRRVEQSIADFPVGFCKYKILPELVKAIEFGGADVRALAPILRVGANLSDDEFEQLISPIVLKLYKSQDRIVRLALLETAPHYVGKMSTKTVSDKLFTPLTVGFNDTSAVIRESTIKAIIAFIPKLSQSIISNDLLRHLARLQQDVEPGIRANTTILLGKIAISIAESVRRKVLVPAFSRSLQDTFPPTRSAALSAITATIDLFNGSDIASRIIPAVSPLLIDQHLQLRKEASALITALLKKLEEISSSMPDAGPLMPDRATMLQQQQQRQQVQQSRPRDSSTAQVSGGGVGEGWAVWALSQVATKATNLISGEMGGAEASSQIPSMIAVTALAVGASGGSALSNFGSSTGSSPNTPALSGSTNKTSSGSLRLGQNNASNSSLYASGFGAPSSTSSGIPSMPAMTATSTNPAPPQSNNTPAPRGSNFPAMKPLAATLNAPASNGGTGPSAPSMVPLKAAGSTGANYSQPAANGSLWETQASTTGNTGWSFGSGSTAAPSGASAQTTQAKKPDDDDDPWESQFGDALKNKSGSVWDSQM